MSIKDTIEAIRKLEDSDTLAINPSLEGHDEDEYVSSDGELKVIDLRELVEAFEAAVRYIELTPCDPDVTADQWKAYQAYQKLSGKTERKCVHCGKVFNVSPGQPQTDNWVCRDCLRERLGI